LTRADAIKRVAVLDASAAVSWFFADERDDDSIAMAAAVTANGAIVPALFRWEVQNAFMTAARRKKISLDDVAMYLEALDELDLQVDEVSLKSPLTAGLGLANRFDLSAYDAAYLELAVRRSLPLMTRDKRLRRAAEELRLLWKP
jgi:predicted nucleic acid-binding protein